MVREGVDDRTGQDDARAAADPQQRRQERDAARDPLARELVADDPEGQREDRAAGSLDHARDDQQLDRAGERRDERADAEHDERGNQRVLLAEHVAEASDDRREHRCAQQVGGEHPRDRGRRRVQVALDLGQRRRDERLQQRERAAGEHQHDEREVVVLAVFRLGGKVSG